MERLTIGSREFPPRAAHVTIAAVLVGTALAFVTGSDLLGIAGVLALSVLSLAYGAVRGLP